MATNDESGLGWLAGSLAWERSFSKLRDAADPKIGVGDTATESVDAVRPLDQRRALRARRLAASGVCPPGAERDGSSGRVQVDDGLPTSA